MKTLVSWSSGKDSAWMIHVLRSQGEVRLGGLLTSVNEVHQRVAMHAVRVELLQAQADGQHQKHSGDDDPVDDDQVTTAGTARLL